MKASIPVYVFGNVGIICNLIVIIIMAQTAPYFWKYPHGRTKLLAAYVLTYVCAILKISSEILLIGLSYFRNYYGLLHFMFFSFLSLFVWMLMPPIFFGELGTYGKWLLLLPAINLLVLCPIQMIYLDKFLQHPEEFVDQRVEYIDDRDATHESKVNPNLVTFRRMSSRYRARREREEQDVQLPSPPQLSVQSSIEQEDADISIDLDC